MSNDEMRGINVSKAMSYIVSTIPLYVKEVYNQNRSKGIKLPRGRVNIVYSVTHPSTMFTMDLIPNIGEVMNYKGKLVRVVKVGRPSYFDKMIEEIRSKGDEIQTSLE